MGKILRKSSSLGKEKEGKGAISFKNDVSLQRASEKTLLSFFMKERWETGTRVAPEENSRGTATFSRSPEGGRNEEV